LDWDCVAWQNDLPAVHIDPAHGRKKSLTLAVAALGVKSASQV